MTTLACETHLRISAHDTSFPKFFFACAPAGHTTSERERERLFLPREHAQKGDKGGGGGWVGGNCSEVDHVSGCEEGLHFNGARDVGMSCVLGGWRRAVGGRKGGGVGREGSLIPD